MTGDIRDSAAQAGAGGGGHDRPRVPARVRADPARESDGLPRPLGRRGPREIHDQGTRTHNRTRLSALVRDVEQHRHGNGSWASALSEIDHPSCVRGREDCTKYPPVAGPSTKPFFRRSRAQAAPHLGVNKMPGHCSRAPAQGDAQPPAPEPDNPDGSRPAGPAQPATSPWAAGRAGVILLGRPPVGI
jgi:hypothetical protein